MLFRSQRQGWLVIHGTEAARSTLEMEGDVRPDQFALADGGGHGGALGLAAMTRDGLAQFAHAWRSNLDAEMTDNWVGEQVVTGVRPGSYLNCGNGGTEAKLRTGPTEEQMSKNAPAHRAHKAKPSRLMKSSLVNSFVVNLIQAVGSVICPP